MKLDIIIYNNTSAVGLILVPYLSDAPLVTFVYDSDEKMQDDMTKFIHSQAAFCSMIDKDLTVYLKNKYKAGNMIQPEDYYKIALIYKVLVDHGLNYEKRDNDFYELAIYSSPDFIIILLDYLSKNLTEKNKEYYFKCAEKLGDAFNGFGYRVQAWCYQEGIFVKKAEKPIYGLMKKAADCGDEQSIEWLKKVDAEREKRRKAGSLKGSNNA